MIIALTDGVPHKSGMVSTQHERGKFVVRKASSLDFQMESEPSKLTSFQKSHIFVSEWFFLFLDGLGWGSNLHVYTHLTLEMSYVMA